MSYMPAAPSVPLEHLRDVSFPISRRGYDPHAVDEYVALVSHLVDELERCDPQPAVEQALAEVGERTAGILREAQNASATLIADAHANATEQLKSSEAQAEQMLRSAQLHVMQLDTEIERLWAERTRLLEDTHRVADALQAIAVGAERRFPADDPPAEGTVAIAADAPANGAAPPPPEPGLVDPPDQPEPPPPAVA